MEDREAGCGEEVGSPEADVEGCLHADVENKVVDKGTVGSVTA